MRQPPAVAPRDASFRSMVSATMPERDPVAGHPPHGSGSAGTPLRICYVFQDEYPWDIRVEKFAVSLADAGHAVSILSRNRRAWPRRESLRAGLDVVRLPAGITAADRALMNVPAFFSPWWLSAIVRTVRAGQADVIIVRDLPLALTAVWAGRITGRPVVLDMAENYPAMIQATWDFYGPKPWDYLVRNPSWLRRLERYVLPKLDGILVVSEPSQRRVVDLVQGKVPVWVVGNTPRLDAAYESRRSPLIDQLANHPGLVLLYVGNMDAKRGLDMFVRALPSIKRTDPRALAVIIGKGVMEPKLRALARELNVEENLLLPGWVDQRDVPSLIAEADIGMIPHLLTEHTDTTIPNKIFDYMAQGKPLVVTQCATLKQIVEECGCGRVYADRDPEALAAAVATLADPGVRAALGEAGRRAVHERYRWDQDARVLQAALGAVTSSHASAASPLRSTQA